MNDLEVVSKVLGLELDDAFVVLRLCDEVDRQLSIKLHGYPKDTPTERDLEVFLSNAEYRLHVLSLARDDDVSVAIIDALRAG